VRLEQTLAIFGGDALAFVANPEKVAVLALTTDNKNRSARRTGVNSVHK
jgi:hypothetical protein